MNTGNQAGMAEYLGAVEYFRPAHGTVHSPIKYLRDALQVVDMPAEQFDVGLVLKAGTEFFHKMNVVAFILPH